ncbi:MAG: hypothetical protein AB2L14_16155 [Candidatus Xenobiia bacterium LiM19]
MLRSGGIQCHRFSILPEVLARTLMDRGFSVSHDVVDKILRKEGYSLQANARTKEGSNNPDRDAQFHYINKQAIENMERNEPVISVDTKKKEFVGEFKNAGNEWLPEGQPANVSRNRLWKEVYELFNYRPIVREASEGQPFKIKSP